MRKAFYFFLSRSAFFCRYLYRKRVKVLAYHTVPDRRMFERQVKHLKKRYNIIDIEHLQANLFFGKALPRNSILVTFDDGDISVLENALPVLKRNKIPSVLFIIAGLIDSKKSFWWRNVEKNFELLGKSHQEARIKVAHLKKINNIEREKYLSQLKNVESRQLSLVQILEMKGTGMEIANHTYSHPMVNKCNEQEVRKELKLVREKFNEWGILGGFSVFAYPNGNWDERSEEIIKEEGIKMAFLFDHRVNNKKIHPLRISRIMVDTDLELNEFKAKVSGVHPALFQLKKKML